MKQDMWELRKIQSQGITDNAQYPAGTYIVFTAAAPYIPLFEQHGKDDIALSLVRHEEAWWIVNHSDELCCAVNEQVMEPHHRMRLNDGDTIEWGLSSWCLARTNDESRPDVSFPQLVQSSESVAEYLDLVRCEMFRHTVFQGEQRPGFLLPQPVWVESLLAALACHDDTGEVDKHRNTALEAITDTGGQWNGGAFDWASDSDSRLGPVLELVTGGVYIWLPFSQIRSLESPQPTRLTDLLWKPVNITLVNGDTHGAWLFTRYSGSESASDALRLCRETAWQDGPGETTVRALGQKVWLTSHGDISLLDMAHCTFHAQENDGA
ncbi:type VI secretion system-associated protein TagK [Salmonella enterica]